MRNRETINKCRLKSRGACWELLCALIKQIKTEYSKTNRLEKQQLLAAL